MGRFYSHNIQLFRKYIKSKKFNYNYKFHFKDSNNYRILLEDLNNLQHNTLFYYHDYEEFIKNNYINNYNLTYNNINNLSNYNIFFYYYNFIEIIENNCIDNIEYNYTDNNNWSSKDTTHVSDYNTMILSNHSERDEIFLTHSKDRVISNIYINKKYFYQMEIIK